MEYKIKTSDIISIIKEAEQSIERKGLNYYMCIQLDSAIQNRFNAAVVSETISYYLCKLLRQRYYPYGFSTVFRYCIVEGIQRELFIRNSDGTFTESPEYTSIKKLTLNDFAKYFEWRLSTGEEYIIITD